MVRALFDTNILVDYLNGIPQARTEIERYTARAVSIVTWMEVMIGATPDDEVATRAFLRGFEVLGLDERIAARAVNLRRAHRMKLPDAIIWATAQVNEMLLVTRNLKDFSESDPGIRCPYKI
jgi:predicted nucleic acid-binding protein